MSGSSVFRLVRLGAVFVALAASAAVFAAAAAGASYVALGDSYSSGVGTNSYTLASGCKRSVYAFPYLYTQQHPGTSLSFVACSGAKTSDVLTTQMTAVTTATTLVTMTVGGNDIGFANLIYQCTLLDVHRARQGPREPRNHARRAAGQRLHHREGTRGVRRDDHRSLETCAFPDHQLLRHARDQSATERTKANALAEALNQVIATHAAADRATYRSAIGPFTGHAVCSSSPWLNGLNLFNTGESYHPNRSGHSAGYLPLVTAVTG